MCKNKKKVKKNIKIIYMNDQMEKIKIEKRENRNERRK